MLGHGGLERTLGERAGTGSAGAWMATVRFGHDIGASISCEHGSLSNDGRGILSPWSSVASVVDDAISPIPIKSWLRAGRAAYALWTCVGRYGRQRTALSPPRTSEKKFMAGNAVSLNGIARKCLAFVSSLVF